MTFRRTFCLCISISSLGYKSSFPTLHATLIHSPLIFHESIIANPFSKNGIYFEISFSKKQANYMKFCSSYERTTLRGISLLAKIVYFWQNRFVFNKNPSEIRKNLLYWKDLVRFLWSEMPLPFVSLVRHECPFFYLINASAFSNAECQNNASWTDDLINGLAISLSSTRSSKCIWAGSVRNFPSLHTVTVSSVVSNSQKKPNSVRQIKCKG